MNRLGHALFLTTNHRRDDAVCLSRRSPNYHICTRWWHQTVLLRNTTPYCPEKPAWSSLRPWHTAPKNFSLISIFVFLTKQLLWHLIKSISVNLPEGRIFNKHLKCLSFHQMVNIEQRFCSTVRGRIIKGIFSFFLSNISVNVESNSLALHILIF